MKIIEVNQAQKEILEKKGCVCNGQDSLGNFLFEVEEDVVIPSISVPTETKIKIEKKEKEVKAIDKKKVKPEKEKKSKKKK